MEQLEKRVRDTEELNDLYIEDSFDLHDQLSEMQKESEGLKKEVQAFTYREQENLIKIMDLERANLQQTKAKETELAAMRTQLQKLREEAVTRNLLASQAAESLRSQQHERMDLT